MRKHVLTASLTCLVQAAIFTGLPSTASAAPVRFDYTGSFTSYSVQTTGTYQIFAFGAQGGSSRFTVAGGLGAEAAGDFALTAGQVLGIAVGGMGGSTTDLAGGGGGGGTFLTLSGTSLLIAGGGGGAGQPVDTGQAGGQAGMSGAAGGNNGNANLSGAGGANGSGGGANTSGGGGAGGGGAFNNGGSANFFGGGAGAGGGASLANGLAGGAGDLFSGAGGFGGGGGGGFAIGGGGGGGYSGGGGGLQGKGGGGGSYNVGLVNADRLLLGGVNAGNGYLTLELLPMVMAPVPEPSTWALSVIGLIGLAVARRKTGPV